MKILRPFFAVVLAAGMACSGSQPLWQTKVQKLEIESPPRVLGLRVEREGISDLLKDRKGPNYLDAVGLISFRKGKLLRATLQVGRLGPHADADDVRFRGSLIAVLGASTPRTLAIGRETVWMTQGNQQTIFAWFARGRFLVLTVHRDFDRPRLLLRALLEPGVVR